MDAATALAQARDRLESEAREHKKAEQYHRRKARDLKRTIEFLEKQCAELGGKLVIETKSTEAQSNDRGSTATAR